MSESGYKHEQDPAGALERRYSRLVLTGFMGAGKSTVGPLLAKALGWRFLDLDSVIEASYAKTVAEIFKDHGEAHFRAEERQAIARLNQERELVLALGGGSLEDPTTLSSLLGSPETCLIFLDAPLPELLERLRGGPQTRPLLTTVEELEKRHRQRLPQYRSAHFTIATTGRKPEEIAASLLERLRMDAQERRTKPHGKFRKK